jgi:hypothetical protein
MGDYEHFKSQLQPTCPRLQLGLELLNILRCFPEEKWMFMERYDFSDGDFACGDFRREVWGKNIRVLLEDRTIFFESLRKYGSPDILDLVDCETAMGVLGFWERAGLEMEFRGNGGDSIRFLYRWSRDLCNYV